MAERYQNIYSVAGVLFARESQVTHCEVSWMGKENCPGAFDPFVPVHMALCRLSGEVGHGVAQT